MAGGSIKFTLGHLKKDRNAIRSSSVIKRELSILRSPSLLFLTGKGISKVTNISGFMAY